MSDARNASRVGGDDADSAGSLKEKSGWSVMNLKADTVLESLWVESVLEEQLVEIWAATREAPEAFLVLVPVSLLRPGRYFSKAQFTKALRDVPLASLGFRLHGVGGPNAPPIDVASVRLNLTPQEASDWAKKTRIASDASQSNTVKTDARAAAIGEIVMKKSALVAADVASKSSRLEEEEEDEGDFASSTNGKNATAAAANAELELKLKKSAAQAKFEKSATGKIAKKQQQQQPPSSGIASMFSTPPAVAKSKSTATPAAAASTVSKNKRSVTAIVDDDDDDDLQEVSVLASQKNGGKPLQGVTFVLSGVENPRRGELRDLATALGGSYSPSWVPGCTHLIAAFANTPKHKEVLQSGFGICVTADWVDACHKAKRRVDEGDFVLGGGSTSRSSSSSSSGSGGKERSASMKRARTFATTISQQDDDVNNEHPAAARRTSKSSNILGFADIFVGNVRGFFFQIPQRDENFRLAVAYGMDVSSILDASVTHVIVSCEDGAPPDEFGSWWVTNSLRCNANVIVVATGWIQACVKAQLMLSPDAWAIHPS